MTTNEKMEKVVPSLLEKKLEQLSYYLVPIVPIGIKPNQITMAGFVAAITAGLSFYLASFNKIWLLVAILGITTHLILDGLDGAVARQRSLTSKAGYFLDLFLDCIAFVIIPLGVFFSIYDPLKIFIFNGIAYALNSLLLIHWVHLRNKWVFPIFGPAEAHLTYILMAIMTFFWSEPVIIIGSYSLGWFDLITLIGVPLVGIEFVISGYKLFQELKREN
ncbi:CDP-alcohol phosphatidyltransferase family protein [Microcoleus sp. D2_18a_D3]|uniref:CDP-alcohol phosphatidyltransferase family protein n=1 Tax=Microcoleus sp. D2_18a_D3 TaxID=3055330 RepID=UPI002FD64BF1